MTQRYFLRSIYATCAAALVLILVGCNSNKAGTHTGGAGPGKVGKTFTYSGSGPIQAVATTGMVADLVKNLGGNHVVAQALMGAGVDPHLYKPTPGDIRKLNQADIVFFNGLHLEGKMADTLEKLGSKKPSVPVASRLEKAKLLRNNDPNLAAYPDPHIWFDAQLWMSAAEVVRDALVEFDPAHKADYESNARDYMAKLKKLDAETRTQIASIPAERRVLVTAHDAFQYFGKAYAIEVQGLQGISTATEASLRDVQRIVDMLVKRKIKAVFVESSVPRRNIEAVAQGAKARGHNVRIGGELFSDAMGKSGTPEGTYIGMVQANVKTIVHALK